MARSYNSMYLPLKQDMLLTEEGEKSEAVAECLTRDRHEQEERVIEKDVSVLWKTHAEDQSSTCRSVDNSIAEHPSAKKVSLNSLCMKFFLFSRIVPKLLILRFKREKLILVCQCSRSFYKLKKQTN